MNRNLDGCYFRVNRDGKWENVCFSDLTPEEREEVMTDRNDEWLRKLCRHLSDMHRNVMVSLANQIPIQAENAVNGATHEQLYGLCCRLADGLKAVGDRHDISGSY